MNPRNRKFIALVQDALVLWTRFPVISRLTDAQPAAASPARLRFARIAS
jgi:hypothetical protein